MTDIHGMNVDDIRNIMSEQPVSRRELMSILRWIAINKEANVEGTRDIVIRILESKEFIPEDLKPILNDLVEHFGLFPYFDPNSSNISSRGLLHYEFYRSQNLPNVVMHYEQAKVANMLEFNSVVLSAPTSFGKSLLIDETISSGNYDNVVIIVPTIALIDETRKRLSKLPILHKLIFTSKQQISERNIFILTPERFLEVKNLPRVDYFIIDEFYKIGDTNDERVNVLNQAFYKLVRMSKKFYLLGPNVSSIPQGFTNDFECEFIASEFSTVSTEVKMIEVGPQEDEIVRLMGLLSELKEPTMIYCRSPIRAELCVKTYIDTNEVTSTASQNHEDAVRWTQENIHPDWLLAKALPHDVAFHHGAMPRHLGKYVVSAFNEGKIKFLFCTSTLIEGVNTAAKNVVIFDNLKSNKQLSYFDYKNICGRAGRMSKYFVGRVFTFHAPPKTSSVKVDIPWYTQEKVSDEILVQLDDSDLKPNSKGRMQKYAEQDILPLYLIRENYNVPVEGQLSLAREIINDASRCHELLAWNGIPRYDQRVYTCELLWRHLVKRGTQEIRTGKQLAYYINQYWSVKSNVAAFINTILTKDREVNTVDYAVHKAMKITRDWFDFKFPKLLSALDNIQKHVFSQLNLAHGDYGYFATQIEYGFCHPTLSELQEFGLPLSVLKKLEPYIIDLDSLDVDSLLKQIRPLSIERANLDQFERLLLLDVLGTMKD